MYVCICNAFTDGAIKKLLNERDQERLKPGEVYKACSGGENPRCCKCLQTVKDMVSAHYAEDQDIQAA